MSASGTKPVPPTPVRNAKYWIDEPKRVVFLAGDQIFKIELFILKLHLSGLAPLFENPTSTLGTEKDPYDLGRNVTSKQMELFLDFIYKIDWKEQWRLSEEELENVLRFCHLWQIPDGLKWAVDRLTKLHLAPARQLELARLYSLEALIADNAVYYIRFGGARIISEQDEIRMGPAIFSILARAGSELDYERRLRAAKVVWWPTPESERSVSCTDHDQCKRVWASTWWRGLARRLLHFENPLPFWDAPELLDGLQMAGMDVGCQRDALAFVKTNDEFGAERDIICVALKRLGMYICGDDTVGSQWYPPI